MANTHGEFPVGALNTMGLGLDACVGLITGQLRLLCGNVILEVKHVPEGSAPLVKGQIQNLFKPVPKEQQYLTKYDFDPLAKPRMIVSFSITMNGKTHDREILVSEKKANMVVSIINFLNVTRERMKVVVSNMKRLANVAMVKVKNLRKRS